MDGNFRFPVTTYGDDTLYFRNGPQRIRMIIRYSQYKKFEADSKIIVRQVTQGPKKSRDITGKRPQPFQA